MNRLSSLIVFLFFLLSLSSIRANEIIIKGELLFFGTEVLERPNLENIKLQYVGKHILEFVVRDTSVLYEPNKSTKNKAKKPKIEVDKKTFFEKNTGAFKRKKKGGTRTPWVAALCSGLVPGLGQIYNGQWYKTPVIYGGAVAIWYFTAFNLKEKKIYDTEIDKRYKQDTLSFNPNLSGHSYETLLSIRNGYQNDFELCLIIAGAVYLLNIIDAVVYAHLFNFDVSEDLSMRIAPYARTNFYTKQKFPLDAGIRLSFKF